MDKLTQNQGGKEVTINGLFDAVAVAGLFGRKLSTTGGIQWGYYGGIFVKSDNTTVTLADGTVALTASGTNYITASKLDGTVSCSTSTGLWDDIWNNWRLFSVVTSSTGISNTPVDYRVIGSMTSQAGYIAPVTKTTAFTVAETEREIICAGTATMSVTLPVASSYTGRRIRIKTRTAYAVNSASSNVVPLSTSTAGTAILPAVAGRWAELVSDGTNWVVTSAGADVPASGPVTKTGNFTVGSTENFIICNGTASITVTLPSAASFVGRSIKIKTRAAFTVISASSNVKPLDTDTAGTAILAATAGKWAELVSDGSNWVIMAGN